MSPPVLGAAAFLIAEFLKISYLDVIWMATIPTCLYYLVAVPDGRDRRRASTACAQVELSAEAAQPVAADADATGFHFISLVSIIVFMLLRLLADRCRCSGRRCSRSPSSFLRARHGAGAAEARAGAGRSGIDRRAERRRDLRRRPASSSAS